jgi:antitoxin component of MazEF toxin-antitoxin module
MEETYSTRLLTFKVIPEAVAEMLGITVGVKLRVYAGGGKIVLEPIRNVLWYVIMVRR